MLKTLAVALLATSMFAAGAAATGVGGMGGGSLGITIYKAPEDDPPAQPAWHKPVYNHVHSNRAHKHVKKPAS
jgi:hypothetical protein